MANIKNMEMATALSNTGNVTIKKSLFGLRQTAVYTPTGSPCDTYSYEYTPTEGERMERLLSQPAAKIDAELAKGSIPRTEIGNMRLEGCVSQDRQFAAVQLFRFVDFSYRPVTDLLVYQGSDVEVIARLLS